MTTFPLFGPVARNEHDRVSLYLNADGGGSIVTDELVADAMSGLFDKSAVVVKTQATRLIVPGGGTIEVQKVVIGDYWARFGWMDYAGWQDEPSKRIIATDGQLRRLDGTDLPPE